ncbi:MAG: tetratricopeptide repeat protein [Gemmatimonadota bacterium]|nr:tetratricopeptide repeat protein [Gemmatimonadota bacterium]
MSSRFSMLVAAGAMLSIAPLTAKSQADPALKLSTSNPQAAAEFRAGVNDLQNLSTESATAHFQAAVASDPNFGLARVLLTGSNPPPDTATLNAELNRGVADAARGTANELILAAAYREGALNHPAAAKALFSAASQLMPSDRLVAFGNAGGFGASWPETKALVARFPDYPLGYNGLAYTSWFNGDRSGALAAARRQVELNPTAPNPHDTYAELLQWNGDFPAATTHYKQAASLSPKFPEAYAGLAEVEALQGHYDQARAYLNQAIANAWTPQEKLGYMRQIAGTYSLQGAPEPLVKQLEAIAGEARAQNNPRLAAITYGQLAASQAFAGNVAAHQSLATAKTASSDVPWQVYYYGAMSHGMLKHWAPAGQELASLKARAATDPTVSKNLVAAAEGYQLTAQGKPADALKVLMGADTTNVIVMNRIAGAHAALGHTAEAAAWNNRVKADYALNLLDFPAVAARRRARGVATTQ